MNNTTFPVRHRARLILLLLGTTAFAVAYGQAPLYYSNQNQYFLHGLADAGYGLLRHDWLANTLDPTPVFSVLVAFTARYLHPWLFYVYHGLLLAVYATAMLGLFASVVGPEIAARRWPVFLALLVLVHSALARWLSYELLSHDYPWYFQAGLATQYVLGGMLQPSVFGVWLIVAVWLVVRGQWTLAVFAVALAATVHSTYLLPGALLTLGFLAALWREGRWRQAVGLGTLALALVVPVTFYVLVTFAPTTAATFAQAQALLVNQRIPHHARPDLWLDASALLQILWVVLGLALVWRTQLFVILAVPFLLGIVLTGVQVVSGNNTLALLFPWRISVVLIPIATTIVLARFVSALPVEQPLMRAVSALALVGLASAGVWIMAARLGFHTGDEDRALIDFVRGANEPRTVYFLPVSVPKLGQTRRGSLSSDFKPPAAKKNDARLIQAGLQRFRLLSGAPIWVDFKSIPYKDTEVLAWHERLLLAETVQRDIKEGRLSRALGRLRRRGVSRLVWPADEELPGLEQVHADAYYQVYRLRSAVFGRELLSGDEQDQ